MVLKGGRCPVERGPILIVLTIFLVFACMGFGPVPGKSQTESLAGVKSVYVIVNIGISREGPTRKGLQEEVETQLREGGIQVLQDLEEEVKGTVAIFNVDVAIWKNGNDPYVYFVTADLFQPVQLFRDEQFKTQAATWQSKSIGSGMVDRIREDVAKVSQSFVKNVQKANKQKFPLNKIQQ